MVLLAAALVAASVALAAGTAPCTGDCSDVPAGVPRDFDCAIRRFALQLAEERAVGLGVRPLLLFRK